MTFNFNDEKYRNISTERKNQILSDVKSEIEKRSEFVKDSLKKMNDKQLEKYNVYLKLLKEKSICAS